MAPSIRGAHAVEDPGSDVDGIAHTWEVDREAKAFAFGARTLKLISPMSMLWMRPTMHLVMASFETASAVLMRKIAGSGRLSQGSMPLAVDAAENGGEGLGPSLQAAREVQRCPGVGHSLWCERVS